MEKNVRGSQARRSKVLLNMSTPWCYLCVTLILHNFLWTLAADVTTNKPAQDGGRMSSRMPPKWKASPKPNSGNNNEAKSGETSKSKEGNSGGVSEERVGNGTLNNEGDKVEAQAMSRFDDWRSNDRFGDYRSSRWSKSRWTRFISTRMADYRSSDRLSNLRWPRKDNRWDTPQDDKWNLRFTNDEVVIEEMPDEPNDYSNQAYVIPRWKQYNLVPFNVTSYNIYKERCCQGKTYPKYPNSEYSCCGSSNYHTMREMCCDGKVHPLKPGCTCCGENYINIDTDICCYHPQNGIVVKQYPLNALESNETRLFTQCCGEELYDTRSHVCFLVTSGDEELANFTIVENKYNRTGCCEGKPYDQDANSCNETGKTYTFLSGPPSIFKQAYEQVQKRRGLQDSEKDDNDDRRYFNSDRKQLYRCGDKLYSPPFEMCCGNPYSEQMNGTFKILKRDPGTECCGTETYNFRTQHCCNGRAHAKPRGLTLFYSCCGQEIYDEDTHLCCDGLLFERPTGSRRSCCGQQMYDRKTQWCCEGSNIVIESQSEKGERCCGSDALVFNTSRHICCNNQLAEIPDDDDRYYYRHRSWRCCASGNSSQPGKAYNIEKEICCNGVVHSIPDSWQRWSYKCCGNETFNSDHSTCCAGKVYTDSSCCGSKEPYNPSTHKCCDDTVSVKPSTHADSCCGKTPYDQQIQTCCRDPDSDEWHLTYKRSREERCCRGKPYDPHKQLCCGSSIIIDDKKSICCDVYDKESRNITFAGVEKKANASTSYCCGLSAYDRETEICCGGKSFPNDHNTLRCCGSKTFNPKTQLCCYGEVHDRPDDDNVKCCGKNAYDLRKQICCHGVALFVDDVNTAMCCYEKSQKV